MQNQDKAEYIVIPLEVQIALSIFLYTKWQENVVKRLDKYLTFPQWLATLEAKPHQLEDLPLFEEDGDHVTVHDFYFVTIEWHFLHWQTGANSVIGDRFTTFELSFMFFTLIWITENA